MADWHSDKIVLLQKSIFGQNQPFAKARFLNGMQSRS